MVLSIDDIITLNIYIMLVLGANLSIGMTKLLSMCQAAFYGIGAYIGAHFLIYSNLPILIIFGLIILFTGLSSLLISYASIRLKGEFFVFATIGFQFIVYTFFILVDASNGSDGIYNIPRFKIFGLSDAYALLLLSTLLMGVTVFLSYQLVESPFGRVLSAIQADEITVKSMGRNTAKFKSLAIFLSATASGLAGVIFAFLRHAINAENFILNDSIFILTALFIGGIGNTKGPIMGAMFVILFPRLIHYYFKFPIDLLANFQQIIYGLALILVLFFHPQGIGGKTTLK